VKALNLFLILENVPAYVKTKIHKNIEASNWRL